MSVKAQASVVGIIFSQDRTQVALIKRRDVPVWVLPGGGIEPHESPEQAILREIEEEMGFETKIIRKIGEYTPINRLTRFTHFYECAILNGVPKVNAEVRKIAFFPFEKLPKYLPPPYGEWIEDGIKDEPMIRKTLNKITYPLLLKYLCLHPILVIRFLLARLGIPINYS